MNVWQKEQSIRHYCLFVCKSKDQSFQSFINVYVCVFLKKKGHGTKPVFYTHGSDQYHFCIGNFYMERERENKIKFLIRMVGNTPKTIIIIFYNNIIVEVVVVLLENL